MRGTARKRLKLGEILVEAGVIDEMQLASALGEQSRWGRRLGVTLVKLGMVEEGHLVRALATQLDLPVATLAGKRIANDVVALVPARVASEHGVMPLFVKREGSKTQLFLGMEDPSNLAVLDDLSFLTGMEIHPVMIGPSELGDAIDRYYLSGSSAQKGRSSEAGETMGERNLRSLVDPDSRPASKPRAPQSEVPARPNAPPASRDVQIELDDSAMLPAGLLDDVAHAVEEAQKTRVVARAVVQLLIEKGIVSLDEVQAQIARQRGSRSE